MADATGLHTLMGEVLSASIAALDTIPTFDPGLGGAPDRTFISSGQPALDCCDQLTVHAGPIREATTEPLVLGAGTRHRQDFRINHVGMFVTITRCVELGEFQDFPPSTVVLEEVAQQTNADAWALWNYIWNLLRAGELSTLCDEWFMDSLTPLQPSGGCSGWLLSMRAELHGYEGT